MAPSLLSKAKVQFLRTFSFTTFHFSSFCVPAYTVPRRLIKDMGLSVRFLGLNLGPVWSLSK